MNIVENIRNFLYDKNYYIGLFENKLYVFNYLSLPKFNDIEINIKMNDFMLKITGFNLKIIKMEEKELLITGDIKNIGIN